MREIILRHNYFTAAIAFLATHTSIFAIMAFYMIGVLYVFRLAVILIIETHWIMAYIPSTITRSTRHFPIRSTNITSYSYHNLRTSTAALPH